MTPDNPDERRLQEATSCAVAAISLAEAHPEEATAARLIYRLAGELYFAIGIRGSSPSDLADAYSCFRQVHRRGGTEDTGVAMRLAEVLHQIGLGLANAHFDDDALACFELAMQIAESHIKQGRSSSFLTAYGRSYDAFANLAIANGFEGPGPMRMRGDNGLREAVDLWKHLRDAEPNSSAHRLALAMSHLNYAEFLRLRGEQHESESQLTGVFEQLNPLSAERSYGEVLMRMKAIAFRAVLHQQDRELVDASMAEMLSVALRLRSARGMSPQALVADLQTLSRILRSNGMTDQAATILRECLSVVDAHSNSFETSVREQIIHEIESQRSAHESAGGVHGTMPETPENQAAYPRACPICDRPVA